MCSNTEFHQSVSLDSRQAGLSSVVAATSNTGQTAENILPELHDMSINIAPYLSANSQKYTRCRLYTYPPFQNQHSVLGKLQFCQGCRAHQFIGQKSQGFFVFSNHQNLSVSRRGTAGGPSTTPWWPPPVTLVRLVRKSHPYFCEMNDDMSMSPY